MNNYMNPEELRKALASETFVEEHAFNLLRSISFFVNNPDTEDVAREFVLRALEKRDCFFGVFSKICEDIAVPASRQVYDITQFEGIGRI